MRVLLTTAPLHGHFFPLVPLGWAFRALGHDVLVATSTNFLSIAAAAGLPAAATGAGIRVGDLADADSSQGIADVRYAHGLLFAHLAAAHLPATHALMDDWKPDFVISERAEFGGPIAAATRDVPRIELQWGVAELSEYRAAAEEILEPQLTRLGLPGMPEPDLTLNPWPANLRLPHAGHHRDLRHVAYNGTERVLAWMLTRGDRPRVCLTLGTVLPHVGSRRVIELVRGIIDRLAQRGYDIVVAMDDDVVADLGPLPANVLHAGRVPLSQTLPGCDVLIHHGGQGTSLTALASGRPQVVLPQFDDQLDNADAVERSGAGISLPLAEATPERVAKHCQYVLEGGRFREAAASVAQDIAAQPSPVELAATIAELARS